MPAARAQRFQCIEHMALASAGRSQPGASQTRFPFFLWYFLPHRFEQYFCREFLSGENSLPHSGQVFLIAASLVVVSSCFMYGRTKSGFSSRHSL
jgi:hypothetical protein